MTDSCSHHRQYLAAIADGELALVPDATRVHVAGCHACTDEVTLHGLLGEKLRGAFEPDAAQPPRRRSTRASRRIVALAATAAGLVIAAGGGVGAWRVTHGSGADPVLAALRDANSSPSLRSTDPDAIGAWCSRLSERGRPVVSLPSLTPQGARMDSSDGATVVTVFYSAGDGARLTVAWLDSTPSAPGDLRVEARDVSGQTVLVLRTPNGTAVISGSAPLSVLWSAAGALETSRS